MDKKKKFIVIGLFVLILLVIILLIVFLPKGKKTINNDDSEFLEVKEQILSQKDSLIFVTSNDETCYLCQNTSQILEYFKKIYNLDIITVEKENISDTSYNKIIEFLDERENYITAPALVMMKDQQEVAVANEITFEKDINDLLVLHNFVEDGKEDRAVELNQNNFDELYHSSELKLILFSNYSKEGNEFRSKVYQLSIQYDFEYNLIINQFGSGTRLYYDMQEKIKKDFDIPYLVIVKDENVVASMGYSKIEEMESFLKKNKFISS